MEGGSDASGQYVYELKIGGGHKLGFTTSVSGRGKVAGKSWHSTVKGTVDDQSFQWDEYVKGKYAGQFKVEIAADGASMKGSGTAAAKIGGAVSNSVPMLFLPDEHKGAVLRGNDQAEADLKQVAMEAPYGTANQNVQSAAAAVKQAAEALFADEGTEVGDNALQASATRKLAALAQPPQQTSNDLQSAVAALKQAAEALFADEGTEVGDNALQASAMNKLDIAASAC